MKTFRAIIYLLITVVICGTLLTMLYTWKTGYLPFIERPAPMTQKEKIDQEKLAYLTAIIWHSFGDAKDDHERVLAGLAAWNTSEGLDKNFKKVFDDALEMVPPGSSKRFGYTRWLWVVRGQAPDGEWAQAQKVASAILSDDSRKVLIASLPEKERCVTTFHRASRANPATDEDQKKIADAHHVYDAVDGSFFVCFPLPKPPGKK